MTSPDREQTPQRLRVMMFLWRLSHSGGIPQVARTVMRNLDRDRFELHLCSARPLLDEDGLEELGPDVTLSTLGLVGTSSTAARLRSSFRLASIIREWSPHIVHSHSGVGWYLVPWLVSSRRKVRTVLEVHDSPQSQRISTVNNIVEGLMLKGLGVVPLVHSTSVLQDLARWSRIPEDRITKIPIGIDTGAFGPGTTQADCRPSIGIALDEIVICYIARLVESKNPQLFIRAAEAVLANRTGVRFVLVGDGPEAANLQAAADAAQLGDRLILLHRIEDVRELLTTSDIFVSTSNYEGFGIAILEAMASGLPVVTTTAGGVQELVVHNETGFITPLGDLDALTTSILTLVDDEVKRHTMGSQARVRARQLFDSAVMLDGYENFYFELARSMRKPQGFPSS